MWTLAQSCRIVLVVLGFMGLCENWICPWTEPPSSRYDAAIAYLRAGAMKLMNRTFFPGIGPAELYVNENLWFVLVYDGGVSSAGIQASVSRECSYCYCPLIFFGSERIEDTVFTVKVTHKTVLIEANLRSDGYETAVMVQLEATVYDTISMYARRKLPAWDFYCHS